MDQATFLTAILGEHAPMVLHGAPPPHRLSSPQRRGGFMLGVVSRWIAEHYGFDWETALDALVSLPEFAGPPEQWECWLASPVDVARFARRAADLLFLPTEPLPPDLAVTVH